MFPAKSPVNPCPKCTFFCISITQCSLYRLMKNRSCVCYVSCSLTLCNVLACGWSNKFSCLFSDKYIDIDYYLLFLNSFSYRFAILQIYDLQYCFGMFFFLGYSTLYNPPMYPGLFSSRVFNQEFQTLCWCANGNSHCSSWVLFINYLLVIKVTEAWWLWKKNHFMALYITGHTCMLNV